jgi:capsule biosynthesis phosphatase
MRIGVDLDGTICEIRKDPKTYAEVKPLPGAAERLRELRQKGHQIIIFTARHMATCDGNVSKVLARVGKVTLEWLEKHNIPYDEIYFGKPNTDIFIDDRCHRFTDWGDISEDLLKREAKAK